MRILTGVAAALFVISTAVATAAPTSKPSAAGAANDLQRAAWACEAGAQKLAAGAGAGAGPRFFLGTVDASADHTVDPLVLSQNTLSGLGSLSNDKGWSNISFKCTLSPDLKQATAFEFKVASPIAQSSAPPDTSGAPNANPARVWYVGGDSPVTLVHGIKDTDDQDFFASCAKGSGSIDVDLAGTLKALKQKDYVTVAISNRPGSGLYVGRGVMNDETGVAMPTFTTATTDPLLGWIAGGKSLHINVGGELAYDVSLKGSGAPAKAFAAACKP